MNDPLCLFCILVYSLVTLLGVSVNGGRNKSRGELPSTSQSQFEVLRVR